MNEILSEHSPFRKGERLQQRIDALASCRATRTHSIEEISMTSAAYDSNNIFAKDPAWRNSLAQGLRGRAYAGVHGCDAAGAGPCSGGAEGASRNLLDADPAALAQTIPVVQKIANAVKEAFDADGVFVCQFNEPAAGQTVFHLHFHVIPRHEGTALKPHSGRWKTTPCSPPMPRRSKPSFDQLCSALIAKPALIGKAERG
jgi:histidine triad (HIT) family protein